MNKLKKENVKSENRANTESAERRIGNFVLRWEDKSRDGHSYLRIKTVSGSWQLRLRDDQECTMMWHDLLEDGGFDKQLNNWLLAIEMVNTSVGDDLFGYQIALARQLFVINTFANVSSLKNKDDKLKEKLNPFINKVIKTSSALYDELNGYISEINSESHFDKEEDDKILEAEMKVRIDEDLSKQNEEKEE